MAITRGPSSQADHRERPTGSVRKGEGGDDVVPDVGEARVFLEGPIDGSLLLSYRYLVAYNLWQGEVSI